MIIAITVKRRGETRDVSESENVVDKNIMNTDVSVVSRAGNNRNN